MTAEDDQIVATRFCEHFNVEMSWISTQTHLKKAKIIKDSEVIICAAKSGIRILEKEELEVVADTNAVPPSGVEKVYANDRNKPIEIAKSSFWGIESLAIGNLKYKTQYGLFVKMQQSEKNSLLHFTDAYEYASAELHSMDSKKEAA